MGDREKSHASQARLTQKSCLEIDVRSLDPCKGIHLSDDQILPRKPDKYLL
ncbi:hypothetical protein L484_004821 [Morus notabilis]|uniref:Uncharacterized protein n=1 Tax=Morus notabilis TaxID=981085 RepID=W9S5R5_9ROSA|nr:hypothetical protein L484_004821 [Morus notabilis]